MVKYLGFIVLGGLVLILFVTAPHILFGLVVAAIAGRLAIDCIKEIC